MKSITKMITLNNYKTIRNVLFSLAVIFFFQAFTQITIIPLLAVTFIIGIDSTSALNFFLYPFIAIGIRFVLMIANIIKIKKRFGPNAEKVDIDIFSFLRDMFTWILAFVFSMIIASVLVMIGFIPNTNPPLLEVLFNSYIGFYIILFIVFGQLKKMAEKQ
ncbi:MAG: hypothetical protein ACMXYG_03090 [Candidatus Woesearchaeota archaeon]